MTVKPGDRLPAATFAIKTEDGKKDVTTDDIFAGKTVVLFAVPGAFTPTCHAKHALRPLVFEERSPGLLGCRSVQCPPMRPLHWLRITNAANLLRVGLIAMWTGRCSTSGTNSSPRTAAKKYCRKAGALTKS